MNSLSGSVSSRTHDITACQARVVEGAAQHGLGGEAEEITDPAHITASGVDLFSDAVLSQRPSGEDVANRRRNHRQASSATEPLRMRYRQGFENLDKPSIFRCLRANPACLALRAITVQALRSNSRQ